MAAKAAKIDTHNPPNVDDGGERWGAHAMRTRSKQGNWDRVITWNHKARTSGVRDSAFVASLSDVFDTHSSILPEWRTDMAALILKCPDMDFMLLTKRAGNVEKILTGMFPEGTPPNVFIGLTVVTQEEADRDIINLLRAKAACGFRTAFLSMEPLLEAVDLTKLNFMDGDAEIRMDALSAEAWVENSGSASSYANASDGVESLDWIIVGGETGVNARPIHIDWVRGLRDQCDAAGTSFLFKRWGNWFPFGEIDGQGNQNLVNNGKKSGLWHEWQDMPGFSAFLDKCQAGRSLDGRTWDGKPPALKMEMS
jgi:protein gp37